MKHIKKFLRKFKLTNLERKKIKEDLLRGRALADSLLEVNLLRRGK